MKVKNAIPEIRKEAFIKAREALSMSVRDLAGKACLSTRQIEQIESGEHKAFYSPNIKFTAAKKVAQILNLKPEDAFDFGDLVAQMPTVDNSLELTADKKQSEIDASSAVALDFAIQEHVNNLEANPFKSNIKEKSSAFVLMNHQKWLVILGSLAIAGFAFISLNPTLTGGDIEAAKASPEEVKTVVSAPSAEEVVQAASEKAAEPVPTPAPAAVVAPVAAAPTPSSTECPVADNNVASYKTDAPKKLADMVYLVAKNAQVVCVVDAAGISQTKQLQAGVGTSVYGKAPLKVLTAGLSQVDLYFQGVKVRPGNAGNTILLEAAPLSTAKNDNDSELR